jgi:hypothetical protein
VSPLNFFSGLEPLEASSSLLLLFWSGGRSRSRRFGLFSMARLLQEFEAKVFFLLFSAVGRLIEPAFIYRETVCVCSARRGVRAQIHGRIKKGILDGYPSSALPWLPEDPSDILSIFPFLSDRVFEP